LKQIGQLGVAVPLDELRHIVPPVSATRFADERQAWPTNVGQGERAVAGHGHSARAPLFTSGQTGWG
jgi:hypothetical protein